jgi:hypothetical protein
MEAEQLMTVVRRVSGGGRAEGGDGARPAVAQRCE